MFLTDTNVMSELRKPRPHGAVVAWARSHSSDLYHVPSIAIYELQVGVELTRKNDAAKAAEIELWIDRIVLTEKIISVDQKAAREAARMMRGLPRNLFEDAMIAAIAKVNGLTVATRNTRDFEHFDVALVNPFLFRG